MKKKHLIYLMLIGLLFTNFACNSLENLTTSNSKLIIQSITGKDSTGAEGSTTIFSDVVTNGSTFNDNGVLILSAVLLNPDATTSTFYHDIIVDQIDIEFTRADGATSVPGVNVPYGHSMNVASLVQIGGSLTLPFVLIQHVAKLEVPLLDLVTGYGNDVILKLEAKITVHGKDLSDKRIKSVSGSVTVWCADFADPT